MLDPFMSATEYSPSAPAPTPAPTPVPPPPPPTPTPAPAPATPPVSLPSNYKLVWNQDFTTPTYANINTSGVLTSNSNITPPAIWSTIQCGASASYTNAGVDHQPFSTDAGYLAISTFAKPNGTDSGGIISSAGNAKVTPGSTASDAYWEASIRLPREGGGNQWPIWWFVTTPWNGGVDAAEVDIAEGGYQIPGTTQGNAPIHLHNWTSANQGGSQGDFSFQNLPNTLGDWQVFGVWFQKGSVTVYLNGTKVTSFETGSNFDTPMETILQITNRTGTTTSTLVNWMPSTSGAGCHSKNASLISVELSLS